MEITMHRHACSEELKSEQQPAAFLREPATHEYVNASGHNTEVRAGQWYVLNNVVGHSDGLKFNIPVQGQEKIRIPLFSYGTASKRLDDLLATAVHLTATIIATAQLPRSTVTAVSASERLHVVVGEVYDTGEGYQIWIGFAFRVPS